MVTETELNETEVVLTGWKEYLRDMKAKLEVTATSTDEEYQKQLDKHNNARKLLNLQTIRTYLLDMQRLFAARSAKKWSELYPEVEVIYRSGKKHTTVASNDGDKSLNPQYAYVGSGYRVTYVPANLSSAYDELYEAAFRGDNEKIKELCLPSPDSSESQPTSKVLLNVNVQIADSEKYYWKSGECCAFSLLLFLKTPSPQV